MVKTNNILSWESDDGSKRCLLFVKDEEKHHKEVGARRLELCKLNKEDEQWQTEKTIDSISSIDSFAVPSEFID